MHVYLEYVLFKSLYVTHQCTSKQNFLQNCQIFFKSPRKCLVSIDSLVRSEICSEFSSLMRISLCISSSKPTCISSQSSWTDWKRCYLASLKTQRGSTGARGESGAEWKWLEIEFHALCHSATFEWHMWRAVQHLRFIEACGEDSDWLWYR